MHSILATSKGCLGDIQCHQLYTYIKASYAYLCKFLPFLEAFNQRDSIDD